MNKSLLAVAMLVVGASAAHAASPWSVKVGLSQVDPTNKESDVTAAKVTVSSDTQISPTIEYAFGNNVSAELLLATPFRHTISTVATDSAASADIATFRELPPTVSLKYTLPLDGGISVYGGVGVNFTKVWGVKSAAYPNLHASNSVGLAETLGVAYAIPNSPYSLALDVRYADINSSVHLGDTRLGTLKVDPMVYGLSLGYKF